MLKHWVPIWVIPLLVIFAVGTVWLRLSIIRTTYAINETDRVIRNLEQEREQLKLSVTGLRSPRRLETLARQKFGLNQPRSEQVIHLKDQAK